jgi:hypothetical protein
MIAPLRTELCILAYFVGSAQFHDVESELWLKAGRQAFDCEVNARRH